MNPCSVFHSRVTGNRGGTGAELANSKGLLLCISSRRLEDEGGGLVFISIIANLAPEFQILDD